MTGTTLKRLTYSPKVHAFVKTTNRTGVEEILDISDYIVRGNVHRKVNQVSSATLELRNPYKMFTVPGNPTFRPMDPITIWLTRLRGRPIQVFTGYLDTTPYLQLVPDTITLEASCTLKRLMYTYWDPGLPFVVQFLAKYGWQANKQTGQLFNPSIENKYLDATSDQLNDGSIGNLLYAILEHVGRWDPHNIFIDKLPDGIVARVAALYDELKSDDTELQNELKSFLEKMIGTGSAGSGGTAGGNINITVSGNIPQTPPGGYTQTTWAAALLYALGMPQSVDNMKAILAWEQSEGGHFNNTARYNPLNTTKVPRSGGYTNTGTQGDIKAYESWAQGLQATVDTLTLKGSGYEAILAALQKGNNATNVLLAAAASSWCPHTPSYRGLLMGCLARTPNHFPKITFTSSGGNTSGGTTSGHDTTSIAPDHNIPRDSGPANNNDPSAAPTEGVYSLPLPKKYLTGKTWNPVSGGFPGRIDQGLDIETAPVGQTVHSITDGIVRQVANNEVGGDPHNGAGFGPNYPIIEVTNGPLKGRSIYYGHVNPCLVKVGDRVKAGDPIARLQYVNSVGANHGHIEIGFYPFAHGAFPTSLGSEMAKIIHDMAQGNYSVSVGDPATGDVAGAGSGSSGGGSTDAGNTNASAFATFLALPGLEDTALSLGLQGQKSLMNDQPLLPFIQQLSEASLRNFMSLPNGDFYAFFPDYFGGFKRKPYWNIDTVEIIDGGLDLSDDSLATHVYVVGDTLRASSIGDGDNAHFLEQLQSGGVMTIFNAFRAGFINIGNGLDGFNDPLAPEKHGNINSMDKNALAKAHSQDVSNLTKGLDDAHATAFLRKFGARPHYEDAPMVRSPYFEAFLAWQRFMLLWAAQFRSKFSLTFMPEVFPGGIVAFQDFDIQCYVEEVIHNFDYESGFTTQAILSAPASITGESVISQGLINATAFDASTNTSPSPTHKKKKATKTKKKS